MNVFVDTFMVVPIVGGFLSDLNFETVGGFIAILTLVFGLYYTYKEKKNATLNGYRSYEKDLQLQIIEDNRKLRENSEKYLMLRKKVLSQVGIDGEDIIAEIERDYKELV